MAQETSPLLGKRNDQGDICSCIKSRKCRCRCFVILPVLSMIVVAIVVVAIVLPTELKDKKKYESEDNGPSQECFPRYTYTPTCPGDVITCTCDASDERGFTQWHFEQLKLCPVNENVISLSRLRQGCNSQMGTCGRFFSAANTIPSTSDLPCLKSILNITIDPILNNFEVTCYDTSSELYSSPYRIELSVAPEPPKVTSVTSTYYNLLTIMWTNVNYTDYCISINDSNATTVLLQYSTHPNTYTFTGLKNDTVYSISIKAINCIGNSSSSSVTGKTAGCPSLRITKPSIKISLCPTDIVEYTCAINAIVFYNNISILWAASKLNCPAENNTIVLMQNPSGPLNTSVVMCGNVSAVMTNINGTCYTSVLTILNPLQFNGGTVKCYDGNTEFLVGSEVLEQTFKAYPSSPQITVNSSTSAIIVSWIPVSTADSYNVSIEGNNVMYTNSSPTSNMYTFSNLESNTLYTVSVAAINCAGFNQTSKNITTLSSTSRPDLVIPLAAGAGLLLAIIIIIITITTIITIVKKAVGKSKALSVAQDGSSRVHPSSHEAQENPQLSWQSDTTTKEPSSTASSKSLQIISQPKTQEIQCGSDAIFSCRANGSHGQVVTYEWYKGNTKIYTDTSGVFTIRMVTNEDEGEYHCVAICESHKVESKIAHLHVKPDQMRTEDHADSSF